jgi:tight adherence protein C
MFDLTNVQPFHIALAVSGFIFVITVYVGLALTSRGTVRRRIAAGPAGGFGERHRSQQRTMDAERITRLIDRAGRLLHVPGGGEAKELRKQLVQAGFFSPMAVPVFHLVRVVLAAVLAIGAPLVATMFSLELSGFRLMVGSGVFAVIGLLLPGVAVDRLRARQRLSYQNAFPDFMDLLVVCVESGQSLPAALDRVSKEIVQFCPGLGANLHIVTLELRAGRTLSDALEGLQGRTALEEVRSLQLLLKQSEELGASIAPTLRVFAEEMRNKRLMAAEAKAHALPVKMTIPMALFIFPIIFLVLMTPVVIRYIENMPDFK